MTHWIHIPSQEDKECCEKLLLIKRKIKIGILNRLHCDGGFVLVLVKESSKAEKQNMLDEKNMDGSSVGDS